MSFTSTDLEKGPACGNRCLLLTKTSASLAPLSLQALDVQLGRGYKRIGMRLEEDTT